MLLGVVLGAAIELVLLRRLRGADIDTTMLVMIGAWIALQNMEQLTWSGVAKSINTPFPSSPLVVGSVSVSWNRLFVFVVALALIAATYALINRTKLGKAMRATFQDRETAALMGVDINRIYTATFALGSGLAAAAGALLGPVFVVVPTMGDLASLKAFAIVILGGLGSIPGATIGGFILAFMEELGAGYVSSGYRDAMGFLLIIVILILKPTGLFATRGADRVKHGLAIAWLLFLASIPLWLDNLYVLHVLIMTGIFIIAAMSLNLLLGYTGQLSLGHVAFFGIGAYTSSLAIARLYRAPAARLAGFGRPQARLVRHAARHRGGRAVRLGDRQAVVQGARRLLRHRHDQLRRGDPPGRAQLGRADARADGAQQHSLPHAWESQAGSRSPSCASPPISISCSPSPFSPTSSSAGWCTRARAAP